MEFIRDERKFGRSVNGKMIQRKALVLFPKLYPMPCASFKASKGWLRRMLLRNDLSFRRVTSVGQKVPSDAPERCDQFLRKMQSIRGYDYIWNMDETPCYFDMPESSTIDTKRLQTVKVKTTGHEKLRFTAVLSAGIKITPNEVKAVTLPLMIIFKNLVKPPSGNFLPRVMVQGIKGGTMTGELMAKTYANDLCGKQPGAYFQQPKSLLIMDSARAHTSKEATDALGGTNTATEIIHGGMTPLQRFIDTHINKPFKDHLRNKWNEWMTGGEIQFTASGQRKRASYEIVLNWVNGAW